MYIFNYVYNRASVQIYLSVSMRDIAEKIFSSPDDLIRTRIKCESRLFSEVVIAVITNFAVFFSNSLP